MHDGDSMTGNEEQDQGVQGRFPTQGHIEIQGLSNYFMD